MRISDWSSDVCSSDLRLEKDEIDRHSIAEADVGIGEAIGIGAMHDLRIADQIGVVQAEFGLEDRVSDFIVGGARKDGGEAGAFGDGVAQACIGKEQDAELCDSNNGKEEQRRRQREERKRDVRGKRESVRVAIGGSRVEKKKKNT